LVVTTVLEALAATILVEVVVTESALASYAALPGIKPNNALRQVKPSVNLSRRTFVIKPFHVYEWSSPHDAKLKSQL
jgi:hypothetical protein